jgi:transposase InsO family protein
MEEQSEGERSARQNKPGAGVRRPHPHQYPFELKLRAVKLHLEEGFSLRSVSEELRLNKDTLWDWVKRYRDSGEEGLRHRLGRRSAKPKVAPAVKQKIVAIKQEHPGFGVKRIAEVLRRVFFLRASRETVRRTLHQQSLIAVEKPKTKRSPPKPRFFERATPNQMWQSDIFTFPLGGKNAYLIGFMDDYSRYLVGCELFRSQSSENVLEVYRGAVAEYGAPKEVLTDQGRQYTNWRGKTRFELELQKDRVHHIKSRPHHPMTLGKIERFWKTIWGDFLLRAKFESFESARERVRLWVKHYNHQRPHQGIGGLCPAERFFEIHKELREVIERGIKDNLEELALRGEPKAPFYMVGRMGEESVVIRAEAGKLRLDIDRDRNDRQVFYDNQGESHERNGEQREKNGDPAQCGGQMPGGVVGVERAAKSVPSVQGVGHPWHGALHLAATGAGSDAAGVGAQDAKRCGGGVSAEATESFTATSAQAGRQSSQTARAAGEDSATGQAASQTGLAERTADEQTGTDFGAAASRVDCGGQKWTDQRQGGGGAAGSIAQDLLQVGEAGASGDGGGAERSGERQTPGGDRSGETGA